MSTEDPQRAVQELMTLIGTARQEGGSAAVELVGPRGRIRSEVTAEVEFLAAELFAGGVARTYVGTQPGRIGKAVHSIIVQIGQVDALHAAGLSEQTDEDELVAFFREHIAGSGLLIILDDVASAEDVEPFISYRTLDCVIVVCDRPLGLRDVRTVTIGAAPDDPEPTLAGYTADTIDGDDQLNIGRDVASLASLIASRETAPPLSIGLFGDWGDGKSFFLRAIEHEVATLAELSTHAKQQGTATAYCSDVRQITFNAWHFADSSLWASLVVRIWEGLAGPDHRAPIVGRLATSQRAVEELQDDALDADRRSRQLGDEIEGEQRRVAEGWDLLEQNVKAAAKARDGAAEGEPRSLIRRTVRAAVRSWRGLGLGLLVAAGAALVGAILIAPAVGQQLAATIAAIAAVTALVTAVSTPIRQVRSELDRIRTDRVTRLHADEAARAKRDAELKSTVEMATARIAELRAERDEVERRRRKTERAIAEVTSGKHPYRFIADRLASDEYSRHLGIMALIRRDFEQLAQLLDEQRRRPAVQPRTDDLPQIDRVVLYIDDLDRCSARRVVEVLEAVHMLLAFDLFTVVVAVDTRWLMNSLSQYYRQELQLTTDNGDRPDWTPATPQNYLEKIFQIPFAMPQMTQDGYARLVSSVFGPTTGEGRTNRNEGGSAPADPEMVQPDGRTTASAPPSPRRDLRPSRLNVTEQELRFSQQLFPLLHTPRAAKRFANTYRLMRSSLDPAELKRLTGDSRDDKNAEYRVAQVLLGILIGFDTSERLFKRILEKDDGALSAAVRAISGSADAGDDATGPVGQLEDFALSLERLDDLPEQIAPYRYWIPVVGRYSFTTVRASEIDANLRH